MKYLSVLLILVIPLTTISMHLDPLETPDWKPWNTKPVWNRTQYTEQRFFEHAFTFLQQVPTRYEQMREEVQNDPTFFNRNLFINFNNSDIKQLELIWEKCRQFPTTEVLKFILKKYGCLVSEDQHCDEGAWLIAQHANHDIAFQQKALIELGKLRSPIALTQYAFLLDRMLLNRGEPQHFGTQLDKQGLLAPINGYIPFQNNPEALLQLEVINNRRKSAGLSPLEESDEYRSHIQNSLLLSIRAALLATASESVLPS